MKTAVRRVLLMSALLSPGALYALGLGEIKLNSALNQPFDAEIELVSATQEDLGALRASLASERHLRPLRSRPPGLPGRLQLPRRQGRRRQGRPARHLAPAGHRALRDAAGRGQLAARPAAARVHRPARPAGLRAGSRGQRAGRRPRRGSVRAAPPAPRAAAPVADDADATPVRASSPARSAAPRRPGHRAGLHLPGAPATTRCGRSRVPRTRARART